MWCGLIAGLVVEGVPWSEREPGFEVALQLQGTTPPRRASAAYTSHVRPLSTTTMPRPWRSNRQVHLVRVRSTSHKHSYPRQQRHPLIQPQAELADGVVDWVEYWIMVVSWNGRAFNSEVERALDSQHQSCL